MRIFDSHQHFWTIGGPGQSWPDASCGSIYRSFGPDDLRAETCDIDLIGTVLVQAQPDDRDTDWMCDRFAHEPLVRGIVGWADLIASDAACRISELAKRPKFIGLRPMLQAIDEDDWLLGEALRPAFEAMVEHELRFDALVQPRHLAVLHRFASRWPDLRIVIDHGAKPDAANGIVDPWRERIAALANLPNVWCKLSGLRTEQQRGQQPAALAPYVAHLRECFGDRLMWGSDWPVVHIAGDSYSDWLGHTETLIGALSDTARHRLFVGAAIDFYGLQDDIKPEEYSSCL